MYKIISTQKVTINKGDRYENLTKSHCIKKNAICYHLPPIKGTITNVSTSIQRNKC